MKLIDLPQWSDLSSHQQQRLLELYGENLELTDLPDDTIPEHASKEGKNSMRHVMKREHIFKKVFKQVRRT